jgi:Ca-activated chloride channel family protein
MTIELDDPKLTAYALGEIEDESENAEIEALVSQSEDARRLVEEIRETASLLRKDLALEPSMELTGAQRERIDRRLDKPARMGRFLYWTAAAAAVLFCVSIAWWTRMASVAELPARAPRASSPGPSAPPAPVEAPAPAAPKPSSPRETVSLPRGIEGGVPGGAIGGGVGGTPAGIESATREELRSLGYIGYTAGTPSAPSPGEAYARFGYEGRSTDYLDVQRARPPFHSEGYDRIDDNPFLEVGANPLSTFSIDVDTASYANVRRFITRSTLPPKDAVRIEEMVNYFDYDYPPPADGEPFSVNVEIAGAPWKPDHRLMRIGLKGAPVPRDGRPPLNLVFLLDVSGSMGSPEKLPLLKQAMRLLVEELRENDQVAIVVYAGASGMVLPRTSGDQKRVILDALDRLEAGGSTNGGEGIRLAYDHAVAHFIPGGTNRVVLATDGDFNVGVTSQGDLTRLIEERAESGVFLSVLGFGMGNYKDSMLEKLADRGNGNYAYIDSLSEARKVLVREMGSTLVTIAKDVKIQIEFNPAEVSSYRLIGYENRVLRAEDFNDDEKDAGEIGAGHTVTALYEIVPAGAPLDDARSVDPLKYQRPLEATERASTGELLTVKLRYKEPDGETSRLLQRPVRDEGTSYSGATPDFKFAAAVASFGMILRDSPHKGDATIDGVLALAREGLGPDRNGYRAEFLVLARQAGSMRGR